MNDWIDVKDRIPVRKLWHEYDKLVCFESDPVLVDGADGIHVGRLHEWIFTDTGKTDYIWSDAGGEIKGVIAWMPLPKSYRER